MFLPLTPPYGSVTLQVPSGHLRLVTTIPGSTVLSQELPQWREEEKVEAGVWAAVKAGSPALTRRNPTSSLRGLLPLCCPAQSPQKAGTPASTPT